MFIPVTCLAQKRFISKHQKGQVWCNSMQNKLNSVYVFNFKTKTERV